MMTSLRLNYCDPLSILRVLTWHIEFDKKMSLFIDQSLFAITGITLGVIRWQFVFSLRDLLVQLPLAMSMGFHFCIAKQLRNTCRVLCSYQMNEVKTKSAIYATPFGAFASVILNAGIWLGGCGSCGTILGTTLLTIFGLGVNFALSRFFYFLALSIMIISISYLGRKLPSSDQ